MPVYLGDTEVVCYLNGQIAKINPSEDTYSYISVFESTVPGTPNTYQDGAAPGWLSNQFYSTSGAFPEGTLVTAVKVYVTPESPAIGMSVKVSCINPTTGSFFGTSNLPRVADIEAAAEESAGVMVEGWNTVNLNAPMPLTNSFGYLASVSFEDPSLYVYSTLTPEPVKSVTDQNFYLAETYGSLRSYYNGTESGSGGSTYGLDIVIAVPTS